MENMALGFSSELRCLAALKQARATFFEEVLACAEAAWAAEGKQLERAQRTALRGDAVAQVAEFFFVLAEGNRSTPKEIRALLERHNADMGAMLESCVKGYTRYGLSEARIKEAIFSPQQIDLVLHECAGGAITFDQRSLGKLLTQVMSFESCRSILVLLARCGLLSRHDFRSIVLIRSNGRLEDMYRRHLALIVAQTRTSEPTE